MYYQKITRFDTANGPGIRTTLWVSGCSHNCPGCHNPETHDPKSGKLFGSDALHHLLDSLKSPHIDGITFSGGDPLYVDNISLITYIAQLVKENYPNKTIWLWTGYLYEDIKDYDIMEYLDVVVDGRYVERLRDITLPYAGSTNQRVIDVAKTRANDNNIVLYHK